MPYYLNEKLPQSIIKQIVECPAEPLKSSDSILIKCGCGSIVTISFRALCRKWENAQLYLCKSCHVSTYITSTNRIEKFRKSFSVTANTKSYKSKCSKNGKKAWKNKDIANKIKKAVSKDNKSNIKKTQARIDASKKLQDKSWFLSHMADMNSLSSDITRLSLDEFITKARITHGDKYDYSKVDYYNTNTNIIIICPVHGEFTQSPHNHLQGKQCLKCSNIISRPQQKVMDLIPDSLNYIINDRDNLNGSEIDIYIPDYNFGIEVHGEYWHGIRTGLSNDERSYIKYKHQVKADTALKVGITLYQFWQHEIYGKLNLIKSMIYHRFGMSDRIGARKCEITVLDNNEISHFYNISHLNGHRDSSLNYALKYKGEIYCALSISKHNRYQWEIIRYACKPFTCVIGGFSRLLNYFIKCHKPSMMMAFADRRISSAGLYKSNCFDVVEITRPNYFYYNYKLKLSRQQCQKHKLSKLLGSYFDRSKTEVDNMLSAGFVQAFDAGHYKCIRSL